MSLPLGNITGVYFHQLRDTAHRLAEVPKPGDRVIMSRDIPTRAGVVVEQTQEVGEHYWSSGYFKVQWSDGKRTIVQGNSLMKFDAILQDAEELFVKMSSLKSQLLAIAEKLDKK
jgi:hypothetical protein